MAIGVRKDAAIRHDVADALHSDIRLDATRAEVVVHNGVVTLRGTVPTLWQKKTAWEISNRIKGVLGIINELQVEPETRSADEQIKEDVERALARDIWVDENNVEVQVDEGKVFLSGVVEAFTEKSYAEDDAWSVPGVVDVIDDIAIIPSGERSDEEIVRDIEDSLVKNIRIDPAKIQVLVQKGVVTLRGAVSTIAQKWLVDDVAWWTAGVCQVVNELHVVTKV